MGVVWRFLSMFVSRADLLAGIGSDTKNTSISTTDKRFDVKTRTKLHVKQLSANPVTLMENVSI